MADCAMCGTTATTSLMGKDLCDSCSTSAQESFWCSVSTERATEVVEMIEDLVYGTSGLPKIINVTPVGYSGGTCNAAVLLDEGYDLGTPLSDVTVPLPDLYQTIAALEAPKTMTEVATAVNGIQ